MRGKIRQVGLWSEGEEGDCGFIWNSQPQDGGREEHNGASGAVGSRPTKGMRACGTSGLGLGTFGYLAQPSGEGE